MVILIYLCLKLRRPPQREGRATVRGRHEACARQCGKHRTDLRRDLPPSERRGDDLSAERTGRRSQRGHDGGGLGEVVAREGGARSGRRSFDTHAAAHKVQFGFFLCRPKAGTLIFGPQPADFTAPPLGPDQRSGRRAGRGFPRRVGRLASGRRPRPRRRACHEAPGG
jgi:hypothetical protein